jgi:hypothetical protein
MALQLRACGYSIAQTAMLLEQPHDAVLATLSTAVNALGVRDEREAVAAARRRGLIL